MKSGWRRLRNQGGPPVPLTTNYRRGLTFDLGAGRASRDSCMRSYGQSGTVFAIVSLLAQAAASPQWRLFKKQPQDGRRRYSTADQGDDQRVQVVKHAALSLWNAPNQFYSGFEFREGANQHLELSGETIWVLNREVTTFPTSMWYVRPDRMEPVPSPDDYLVGWIYTGPNGEQIPLNLDEVIVEKLPDPLDPFRGAGPVASILPNIQQQRYATEYQRNLFINGADPGGLVQIEKRLTEAEWDEFTDRWRESHQGVARAGRVGILENGATWVESGQSNKDLEYGNLRLANRDELREAWRMHKSMLGTVEDVNRANAQTAEEVFVSWSEIPRLDRRKETLNTKLLPLFGDQTVEFDYDDPSLVNAEAAAQELLVKSQAVTALINAGYDPHDVLEVVGLPDMDVVEKATQQPALPPGWVAPPGPGGGGDGSSGDAQPAPGPEVANLVSPHRRLAISNQASPQWPGWDLDMQAVTYWAPMLTAAVTGALTRKQAQEYATAYLASYPDGLPAGQGKREAVRNAKAWLAAQGLSFEAAVAGLMPGIITDGYLIGAASAAAMIAGEDADTGEWQPGDTDTAAQQIQGLGVATGLMAAVAGAGTAAMAVSAGYVGAVAGALVDGILAGYVPSTVAGLVTAALRQAAHATTTVLGHVSDAVGAAASALYAHRGVGSVDWLNEQDAKICPACLANASMSPQALGARWPSGDAEPPAHINCRCALTPAPGDMANRLRRVLSDGYVPVESGRR